MRSAFDFAPYRRSTIGFDRLFDLLENSSLGQGSENYPPFDLIKIDENHYRINLAVAGFGRDEIDIMERWLRDRDQALPEAGAHADHMPGMITAAELEELRGSMGTAFDRLFLTFMIGHHQGALAMVEELFAAEAAVQDPATFKLASDIHVDQTTEIARMQRLLDSLTDVGRGG